MSKENFMLKAIELAEGGMKKNEGGPFGAIVVKNNKIVGQGNNKVISSKDPTAHAEIMAIRDACSNLSTFDLSDCQLYTTCEPCPMCLGAIYWANISKIYYASTKKDAAKAGFRDDFIYDEFARPINQRKLPAENILNNQAGKLFDIWDKKIDKTKY